MLKSGVRVSLLVLQLVAVIATQEVAESYFPNLSVAEKSEYTAWLDGNFGTSYSRHTFLPSSADPDFGAAVFWNINGEDVKFAVAVRATGWLSFGVSEAGGMLGSDVVRFETVNPTRLIDSYILEDRKAPLPDDCQDWNLAASTINDGWIILEVNRKLDTGDDQDLKILNDQDLIKPPTRLIAAWGNQSGLEYHGSNRARNSVRLFVEEPVDLVKTLLQASDRVFTVTENNYEIPARDTTYHTLCKTFAEIQQELGTSQTPQTIIGATPVIAEDTAEFVHHFTVYAQANCNDAGVEKSMIYVWGPGDDGWALPDDVGFPMFDTADRQALMVEIHYNNPAFVSGKLDSSGIRFYVSDEERPQKAAVLELGDPFVQLGGQPISSGLTQYEFSCPGSCSSTFFGGSKVTVIAEFLHMHQTGVRMTNEVIRGNEVVHEAKVDVFEFDQQGGFRVPQASYEISPGDSFRTSCYYRDGGTFGLSSQEEMCIAYVMYYPAKSAFGYNWMCPYGLPVPQCSQELTSFTLQDVEELDRSFGSSGSVCAGASVSPPPTVAPTSGSISQNKVLLVLGTTVGLLVQLL